MLPDLKKLEVWFITGSQHLYGPETLQKVAEHSSIIADALHQSKQIPVSVICKPTVKSPEEIYQIIQEANGNGNCIGLVCWMHTFSPAKMWINGLKILHKPFLHFHTQFNRDIPWNSIDMDFMNLNQSAHGDREFGFITARMNLNRKVVVGHWQDEESLDKINIWCRAAAAWHDWQSAKFVRFGDNMRYVAVTEGDKVEAEIKFGYSVNTCGVGDLVNVINSVTDSQINTLVQEYIATYQMAPSLLVKGTAHESLREAAKIEIGIEKGIGVQMIDPTKHVSNTVFIDKFYSPIEKVSFSITNAISGDSVENDRLDITIETNGSLTPKSALGHAAYLFRQFLSIFTKVKIRAYIKIIF
jgi:L-arabinose isomerase